MSRNHTKVVTRHIWSEYMECTEEYRHVFQYREIYKQRSETIERVFPDHAAWFKIYYAAWSGKGKNAGDANFCVHEFKEIGNMETQEEAAKAACTWQKYGSECG